LRLLASFIGKQKLTPRVASMARVGPGGPGLNPFRDPPGRQIQVDFGEKWLEISGVPQMCNVFVDTSRAGDRYNSRMI
jgi:hypothetical protein